MDINQRIDDLLARARVPQAYRSAEFLSQLGFSISDEKIDEMAEESGMDVYGFIRMRLSQLVNVCTALDFALDLLDSCEAHIAELETGCFADDMSEDMNLN